MEIEQKVINTLRKLSLEQIMTAKSGHPGVALGAAPIMFALYNNANICPKKPDWFNRDRIIISCGHASSLIYSTLHLFGYNVSIDDLKQFRQLGSYTPGHPEETVTSGVDCSTGALGQGFANAVGFAIAENFLSEKTKKYQKIVDHYTFVMCGDGDLMEGISYEAAAMAGNLKLNKLIALYDSNDISLDGKLSLSSNEDVQKRFEACGWQVLFVKDANQWKNVNKAIIKAKQSTDKPTLIICKTVIGYGSKLAGSEKCHGKPFSDEDVAQMCASLGVSDVPFKIDEDVLLWQKNVSNKGEIEEQKWQQKVEQLKENNKELYNEIFAPKFNINKTLNEIKFKEALATRDAGKTVLNKLANTVPNLIGGSADVAGSVYTKINGGTYFTPEHREGRSINFGIREFAMAAIQNGMLLHGGLRTYVGCFLVFADYLKPAIRMAALSHLPAVYLFSHDSIAVGEDGPTHQPIEQLAMLRSIPNVEVFRPCDANEVATAYRLMFEQSTHPCCIILTRQALPVLPGTSSKDCDKGGYVVSHEVKEAQITIIASGSEVSLAVEAQEKLLKEGIDSRVVSMMSQERFLKQDPTYIKETLGNEYGKRIAVEMLSSFGWHRFAPHVMSIDTFGASAPAGDVIKKFNFTSDELVRRIKEII